MKHLFKIICISALLFLCACEPENPVTPPLGDQEQVPDSPQEKPEPEPVPVDYDVIVSAKLTFSYLDFEGTVNVPDRRIDFTMELYGDDAPNLRYLPVTFELKDGYSIQGTDKEYIRLILSQEEPASVSFVKDDIVIDYDVYVSLVIKEAPCTDFNMKSGVNLSYWFQEDIPWPDDVTVEQISGCGFDHVRLPFDSKVIFDSEGGIRRNHMDMLHDTVSKCLEEGLNVILDMHWLVNGNLFYDEDAAEELLNNWKRLMEEFSGYPNERVAYEILNEPHGYGWEQMQRNMLHVIRSKEPGRVVFVSPQGYNAKAASEFTIHTGDPNIVITFHYYEPMLASHRKAWGYTGPSHYPGYLFSEDEWNAMSDAEKKQAQGQNNVWYDYDYTLAKFRSVVNNKSLNGLRVHCGEFGMSKTNIRSERVQWFKDIVKAFNECDIAYTVWENWGGDFGPGNWASEPDEEIIDILLCRD